MNHNPLTDEEKDQIAALVIFVAFLVALYLFGLK